MWLHPVGAHAANSFDGMTLLIKTGMKFPGIQSIYYSLWRQDKSEMTELTKPCRILMLLENGGYPDDTRVANEATALAEAGHTVSVVCPRDAYTSKRREVMDGVTVYRYPAPPEWSGLIGYVVEYGYSLTMAFFIANYLFLRYGFDALHVHTPPDMYVTIGAWFKLFGVRYVMDHHDLSPELYQAQSQASEDSLLVRILKWFERRSCRLADQMIQTNESQRASDISRCHVDPARTNVVRNGPRFQQMVGATPLPEYRAMDKIILGYMGCIGFQDGVDSFLQAMGRLTRDLNRDDFFGLIIGDGPALQSLKDLSVELQLDDKMAFVGYQQGNALYSHIASCDIMVTPDPVNSYNASCTMIKTMEYMAMSKPVVGYDMPEHRYSAGDASLYAKPGDVLHFAECLQKLMDEPDLRQSMGEKGRRRIESELAWKHQKESLIATYRKVQSTSSQLV